MITLTIPGMTVHGADSATDGDTIMIDYMGRSFVVRIDDVPGAGEYDCGWSYDLAEVIDDEWELLGGDDEFDSGTTALQAAQARVREMVDADNERARRVWLDYLRRD